MNKLKFVFAVILTASSVASADHCYNASQNIEGSLRSAASLVSALSSDLRGVARLESSLTNLAGQLGADSLDLDRELGGDVADPERSVRSAQGSTQSALSELRRASGGEELGSEAFRMAGRAATTLENAKQIMTAAANRVGDIKTHISQLHRQLADNSKSQDVKQQIEAELFVVRKLESRLDIVGTMRRMDNQVVSYLNSCSTDGFSCSRIRSDLSMAAGRARDIGMNVTNSNRDFQRFERVVSNAGSNLKILPAVDINTQLNSYIDNQILPSLQDAVNNLHNAATAAREASQTNSGVRFDQLLKGAAIPSAENADRLVHSGLSGLSGLRSRISDLARQINSNSGNQAVVQDLRQAAREIASLTRQAEDSMQKLGGQWGNGGYLHDVRDALNDHQRSGCEAH